MNQIKNTKLKNILQISMFAIFLSACSMFSIPLTIPITMQSFGVFLACLLIGGKNGTCSITLWILLGLIGLPVFSGYKSGLSALLGPTGGYIVGFVFIGIMMWIFELINNKSQSLKIISMVFGIIICYTFGTIWFVIVYTISNNPISIIKALSICVLPFISFDIIKIVLAFIISKNKTIKNIFSK